MSVGIVELVLVFGAVLVLAVIDLLGTKRGTTSITATPEPKPMPKPPQRKTSGTAKPRSRKPGTNGG